MKFVFCYWTNNHETNFIEDVFIDPPVEKYLKGEEFSIGNKILKRPHSFVSFEVNIDPGFSVKLSKIIKRVIKSEKLKQIKELKSSKDIDVAFKVFASTDEEFPAFFEDDLSFIISFSNWMTFNVDTINLVDDKDFIKSLEKLSKTTYLDAGKKR
jgi:hypothetical protein